MGENAGSRPPPRRLNLYRPAGRRTKPRHGSPVRFLLGKPRALSPWQLVQLRPGVTRSHSSLPRPRNCFPARPPLPAVSAPHSLEWRPDPLLQRVPRPTRLTALSTSQSILPSRHHRVSSSSTLIAEPHPSAPSGKYSLKNCARASTSGGGAQALWQALHGRSLSTWVALYPAALYGVVPGFWRCSLWAAD